MAKERIPAADRTSLWIRFVGEDLVGRPVPIQDLSLTMLAVQRLIHKAHLAREERLTRFAVPSDRERAVLALRLGERRRESDAYNLLTDPLFAPIVGALIVDALKALAAYAVDATKRKGSKAAPPEVPPAIANSQLAIVIYPQVLTLTQRVDEATGISEVEISSPGQGHGKSRF